MYDATFQLVKTDQDLIGYLMIINMLFSSNHSKYNPILSLCLFMKRLYNTMQYANENTTDCLARLFNTHKVNEACNGILITKGV